MVRIVAAYARVVACEGVSTYAALYALLAALDILRRGSGWCRSCFSIADSLPNVALVSSLHGAVCSCRVAIRVSPW